MLGFRLRKDLAADSVRLRITLLVSHNTRR